MCVRGPSPSSPESEEVGGRSDASDFIDPADRFAVIVDYDVEVVLIRGRGQPGRTRKGYSHYLNFRSTGGAEFAAENVVRTRSGKRGPDRSRDSSQCFTRQVPLFFCLSARNWMNSSVA